LAVPSNVASERPTVLIVRRLFAVLLWLLAFQCAVDATHGITLPARREGWPGATNPELARTIGIILGCLVGLIGFGLAYAARRLWGGDARRRWFPPRVFDRFYWFGTCFIVLLVYAIEFRLGPTPIGSIVMFGGWFIAALFAGIGEYTGRR
jgi:hypothetical protein